MREKLADPFLIGINRYLTKKTNLKKNPQIAGFFMLNQENFPNSEKYYKEALSIPIYYSLREKDQNFVNFLFSAL